MAGIVSRDVEYAHNSTRMLGFFCVGDGAAALRPGVLIVHDAFGLGDRMKAIAARLAGLGYAAFAVDLWGGRKTLTDRAEIGATIGRFTADRAMWMGRIAAAHAALKAEPGVDGARIGAIGYCFGGASVLECARVGADFKAVVSFHGGLEAVGDEWTPGRTKAKVLVTTGFDDPMAPPQALVALLQAMTKAGVAWEADVYGHVKHAFTNPDAHRNNRPDVFAYDAGADARSWGAMRALFAEVF